MTEPWVAAIAAIVRGTPKLPGALCRGHSDTFDGDDEETAEHAAAICRRCPALQPCSEWSGTLPHNQAAGVLAGQYREWVSHPSVQKRREAG